MIATRLHFLSELVGAEPLVSRMQSAAHYVIGDDLVAVLAREDVQKSIIAMIEAGIARLPYAPILIEYQVAVGARRFVLLDEAQGGFRVEGAFLMRDRLASVSSTRGLLRLGTSGVSLDRCANAEEGAAFVLAAAMALLMLNIRGVDKRLVEPTALNRARAKRGCKAKIPSHTVVRIGTIYDRSGRHATDGGSGRTMPVHLRAGHTRMQAFGENFSERKPVYIAPVLVNYRDTADAAPLPRKAVRL
ncbi:MAG: hypothetical protein MEQ84_07740 [Mesorhizobium sp.]|nr:hypothetical protein [Mesorhizobium sp.]